jgi:hypothetical protein
MDSKMSFSEHIDVAVGTGLVLLVFVKRMSTSDPYTFKTLIWFTCAPEVGRHKFCWKVFYEVHANRIELVQRKSVRCALWGLEWTIKHDILPFVDKFTLIRLETLWSRRANSCILLLYFAATILSRKVLKD